MCIRKLPILFGVVFALTTDCDAADISAEAYKTGVGACMRTHDLQCAEDNWLQYIRLRPTDGNAVANLGIVMNRRDNHEGAILQFERAIDLGEGAYDLFAYYADSLTKIGRAEDAIDWSYKTLAVVPRLVDVRGSLAKLLVLQKRYYEALSLLEGFDDQLKNSGHAPYFEGQRIAIEAAIARNSRNAAAERAGLRLPKHGDHFFVPVTLGESRPSAFMIDTGASGVSISEDFLAESKVNYKVVKDSVSLRMADGRKIIGRVVTVPSLKIGPYELKGAMVFTCKSSGLLLGQSALSKFDLKSSRVQGVEFLTLSPRS
jgi:tetratricopeptide (TPR) repeat protein